MGMEKRKQKIFSLKSSLLIKLDNIALLLQYRHKTHSDSDTIMSIK